MSEWKKCRLGNVATFRTGKLNSNAEIQHGIYPFFTCSPKTLKIDTFAFDEETLLLAGNNANGIFSLKHFKGKFNAYQRTYLISLKNNDDYKFVFYSLKLQLKNLESISHGTATKYLTLPLLNCIPILIPPLLEQKAIAAVLSSLDDKIDLLHRQNKTLEAMAETLFRQWFVEEAEEDWEERSLSSIATFLNGLACQKYLPKNDVDKLPVLKIKQLRNGLSDDCDWCTTDVKPEYIIENGDVIFSWSASLMVKIWNDETCILNQHLFKVTSNEFPKWYYYLWSKYYLEEFISISASFATTMGHIKRCDLDDAMVLLPSNKELLKFTEIQTPIIDEIVANNKQLKKLIAIRDTLLPKLMSGEVRIQFE